MDPEFNVSKQNHSSWVHIDIPLENIFFIFFWSLFLKLFAEKHNSNQL